MNHWNQWIRESNLIEGIDDLEEDMRSLKAWNWLLAKPELSLAIVRQLHEKIMRKSKLPKWQIGQWRRCQVWVGGHKPPKWEDVPKLIKTWFDATIAVGPLFGTTPDWWARDSHVEFERIHPFIDGNGRVGRMIFNYHRLKLGIEPLLIKASKRGEYYKWFNNKIELVNNGGII